MNCVDLGIVFVKCISVMRMSYSRTSCCLRSKKKSPSFIMSHLLSSTIRACNLVCFFSHFHNLLSFFFLHPEPFLSSIQVLCAFQNTLTSICTEYPSSINVYSKKVATEIVSYTEKVKIAVSNIFDSLGMFGRIVCSKYFLLFQFVGTELENGITEISLYCQVIQHLIKLADLDKGEKCFSFFK
jgi:hypothetical protein